MVLVIIGVVMAIAAPSLRFFSSARPVANAAAQFVALSDYARSQAIAEGRVYRLNLDLEKGTFWLTAQERGNFVALNQEFGRTFSLPEGTTMSWTVPPPTSGTVSASGLPLPEQVSLLQAQGQPNPGCVEFYADGHTQPASLRLADRGGNVLDIACPAAAERFQVVKPSPGETNP
jgi:type II secretory pathway pseudopilin PulG